MLITPARQAIFTSVFRTLRELDEPLYIQTNFLCGESGPDYYIKINARLFRLSSPYGFIFFEVCHTDEVKEVEYTGMLTGISAVPKAASKTAFVHLAVLSELRIRM